MRSSAFISRALVLVALFAVPTVSFGLDDSTWIRTYRGGYGHSIYETPDGGAIMAGSFGAGLGTCCQPWLVKLSPDGSVQWQLTYQAPGLGGATSIIPTQDGGYVLAGDGIDFMVIKVDANGNVQWANNYGDGGYTHLRVLESNEGNLLVTGATKLQDDGFHSNGRAVLLDPDGNVLWQKVYGRPITNDYIASATLAYNGNFIVAGSSQGRYWVMELDQTTGSKVWENIYGGVSEDTGLVVAKVLKRYYLVVGASDTFSEGGLRNWWAVILTPNGKLWKEFSLGGHDAEDPHTAISTSDGGFMIGGGTGSFGAGFSDIWLVKFDSHIRIEWQKTYGMPWRTDHAWQIQELPTGYAVIGDSYYFPTDYEVWLMTLDRDGNIESGDCGSISDTNVSPWRTRAAVRDAATMTFNTHIRPINLKVTATDQSWPIEACDPFPPTD